MSRETEIIRAKNNGAKYADYDGKMYKLCADMLCKNIQSIHFYEEYVMRTSFIKVFN